MIHDIDAKAISRSIATSQENKVKLNKWNALGHQDERWINQLLNFVKGIVKEIDVLDYFPGYFSSKF